MFMHKNEYDKQGRYGVMIGKFSFKGFRWNQQQRCIWIACDANKDGKAPSLRQWVEQPGSLQAQNVQKNSSLDVSSIAAELRRCGDAKAISEGKRIHETLVQNGLCDIRYLGNLLVQMYGKCGALKEARLLFDHMRDRNIYTWNIMLTVYIQAGRLEAAADLFGLIPEPNVVSWNAMITAYAQNGNLQEACFLFHGMPERSVVSWNTMITAYSQHGNLQQAVQLFYQMPQHNSASWNAMITAYLQHGRLDRALALFNQMPTKNTVACSVMISAFSQHGKLEEARQLFRQVPEKSVAASTAMISAYKHHGMLKEALQLFYQMLKQGIKPDRATFAVILSACGNASALEDGILVHDSIIKMGIEVDLVVGNALVDMYGKCGNVVAARKVFDEMHDRDVVSWTAMIAAYSQQGFGKEVFQIFQKMQVENVIPNDITFVSILSACSRSGLMDEGSHCFVSISKQLQKLEHWACAIDLLGRTGLLEEAEDFIINMPFPPDETTWTSLFGSCRIHSDMERANRAVQNVFKLRPADAENYVLLSNIYASAYCWEPETSMEVNPL